MEYSTLVFRFYLVIVVAVWLISFLSSVLGLKDLSQGLFALGAITGIWAFYNKLSSDMDKRHRKLGLNLKKKPKNRAPFSVIAARFYMLVTAAVLAVSILSYALDLKPLGLGLFYLGLITGLGSFTICVIIYKTKEKEDVAPDIE